MVASFLEDFLWTVVYCFILMTNKHEPCVTQGHLIYIVEYLVHQWLATFEINHFQYDEYETISKNLTDGNVGSRKHRNVRDKLFVKIL